MGTYLCSTSELGVAGVVYSSDTGTDSRVVVEACDAC